MEAFETADVVIVGGGVVGMAAARALALAGREVVLLEAEPAFGTHTSSRNSEVIHAGIYYETHSVKARFCVSGRRAVYDYCRDHAVAHRRVGKLIVANSERQVAELERIHARAVANGVTDLEWLDASEVASMEPCVVATRALHSPSTGIVDSHELLSSFRRDAEAAGAIVVTCSPVTGGSITESGVRLSVSGSDPVELECRALVNAAGLFAQRLAHTIAGFPPELIPPCYFAKGHYFTLAGRAPFRHLVYPVPEPGGLGIHVTLDLAGAARFGPDVSWVEAVDYSFDATRVDDFYRAIRTYYPNLEDGSLQPGYTGIRPKLVPPGSPPADFLVQGPEVHGLPLVNLFGIESPGLTASLALADHICELLQV